jgi:hypothetical protein
VPIISQATRWFWWWFGCVPNLDDTIARAIWTCGIWVYSIYMGTQSQTGKGDGMWLDFGTKTATVFGWVILGFLQYSLAAFR